MKHNQVLRNKEKTPLKRACESLAAKFFPHIPEPHGSEMIEQLLKQHANKSNKG